MNGRLPNLPRRSFARVLASATLLLVSILSLGQTSQPQAASAVPASRQAGNVAVITIKGEISQTTLDSIHRRIELAQRAGAEALVFELDTPGGDLYAALGICNEIKGSSIRNTVAWVHPNAYSAGAVIALACREIVISDPATMGDAVPIMFSPVSGLKPLPESERQKLLVPLLSELVDSARRNHYDEFLAQGIATRGVELWLVEHNDPSHDPARLFVNRAEYLLLFGEDPPETAPSIVAAPPPPAPTQPEAAPDQAKPPESPAPPTKSGRRSGRGRTPDPKPIPESEPGRFVPAGPSVERIARDFNTPEQELPQIRPVLTSADRGQWVVKERVSSGDGPLLFKTDQMRRFGLASAIIHNDEELKQFMGARNLIRLDQSWSEGLVVWLTWLPIQGLLVVIFLIALFVEMTHPGLVFPATVAVAALVGLLAPPLLINLANWWEVAAILVGIALVALEIFVIPGFGVSGVLGLILLFGGLVGTFVPPGGFFPDSSRNQSDLLYGVVTLVMSITTACIGMYFFARNFKSLPVFNRLVLKDPVFDDQPDELLIAMGPSTGWLRKGAIGTAVTPLRPSGRVELVADGKSGSRIIDAVAEIGYIPAGSRVRVVNVSDFRIGVELDAGGAGSGEAKA